MCRAYLSVWFDENGNPVFNGRANCGAITLNTVRPALMFRETRDEKAYFKELKKYFDLATEGHLWQFNRMKNVLASSNPLFFCEGGCHMKLKPDETIEKAIRTFTWSYGYIGLNEVNLLMTGKEEHEDNSFSIKVLEHLNKWKDEAIKKHGLLFAIYGTPAEKYAETCRDKEFEHFGEVKGITDKKYFMNSFHVNVTAKIDPFEKMKIEKPMFDLSNGGHIFYSEYPINHNIKAISQVTRHAMKMGLYEGVNFDSAICENCGKEILDYDKTNPHCSHCGSKKIIVTDRVCGYLSYYVIDGDTRVNEGKEQENQDREVHYGREVERGIHDFEILNGEGLRVSVWFTGCPHHCEDCHNQFLWKHDTEFKLNKQKIIELCKERKALSVLGGEPFAPYNREELLDLLKSVKEEIPDCSIFVWTGYEYNDIKNLEQTKYIDKLICGKFEKDKKCENSMYGSSNQYEVDLN
ncbi:anaerobic ribonucleoside-triphosphate reductase [Clostridium beijerinckii]|uniref:anaerobic ribonucleoside-triphosphate reductase n=1 Tax=Clostridium beijerinckii TaxID=1520 RepID=UPI00156E4353|nr:anaerobic ribonucleoside-triphosphate reductase activating protein [Clostridium beijerinckii]NYC68665.1 anaerobic ribonucleoside-triphosphate reductase activating protein [Clostridium beijerinckii]NYC91814.1 anaerobic ribonucleoside-triphosphate reductase activating protein [Clostridium beijerinckii]